MFHFELYVARYRGEEEVKINFQDIRKKVNNFIKFYHKINNDLLDEDEQVILQLTRVQYIHKHNRVDFPYEHAWDIFKDVPYF